MATYFFHIIHNLPHDHSAGQRRIHFEMYEVNCMHVNIDNDEEIAGRKNEIHKPELHLSMVKHCRFVPFGIGGKCGKKVQREIFIKLSLKFVHFSFDIRGSRVCKLCNNRHTTATTQPTTNTNRLEAIEKRKDGSYSSK